LSARQEGERQRFQWTAEEAQRPERALVLVPEFQNKVSERSKQARIEEAVGLARAILLEVCDAGIVPIKTIKPGTLFGSGKINEISGVVKTLDIGLVIVDGVLSPKQQQNLEKAWNCKVLDRTGLILEIFGERAQTKEGRLQVELAHLNYQKGRLVRSWTHLERQRGGLGFVGGPGETQIESDRRMIQERINGLEGDLEKIRRTRELHRRKRKKVPYPVVALVGYTNAGKSTLFNSLTGAGVMAKDLLFATLDPTLRQLDLPKGTRVILSDTVGFVSNLPTHLVAAFRATLEEVIEAELILHVRDIAHEDSNAQAQDVYSVLEQLGIGDKGHANVVEVWNKIDLLGEDTLSTMRQVKSAETSPILVSAQNGQGIPKLFEQVEGSVNNRATLERLLIPVERLSLLPELYENGQIIERTDHENGAVELLLRVDPATTSQIGKFRLN